MKKFHISDILTIITGKMVSIRNMEGVYDILNYMADDNLHTHQLPRVMEECRPYLIEQFPDLVGVVLDEVNDDNLLAKVEEIESKHGSYFEVKKLPEGVHKYINPIAEMFAMQSERG